MIKHTAIFQHREQCLTIFGWWNDLLVIDMDLFLSYQWTVAWRVEGYGRRSGWRFFLSSVFWSSWWGGLWLEGRRRCRQGRRHSGRGGRVVELTVWQSPTTPSHPPSWGGLGVTVGKVLVTIPPGVVRLTWFPRGTRSRNRRLCVQIFSVHPGLIKLSNNIR